MSFERMVEFPVCDDAGTFTVAIYELPTMTDEDLEMLEISREELHEVFADGMRQMEEEGITDTDRVRPCADRERASREWFVILVRYSELSDPLNKKEHRNA
jgi:hypothetical protein